MTITTNLKSTSVLLLSALLLSCATMSKDECLHADWYIKGLADASDGYPLARLGDHGSACARVGITPKRQDYEAGHRKGARLYCVAGKGYSEGRRGASYNGICPRELEDDFLRAYRDGQQLFAIQQKINVLSSEIANNEALVDANYDQIHRLKHEIIDSDSSSQERRNKLRRIDDLQYDIVALEIRIDSALREMELYRRDFLMLEDRHYRMGYRY